MIKVDRSGVAGGHELSLRIVTIVLRRWS